MLAVCQALCLSLVTPLVFSFNTDHNCQGHRYQLGHGDALSVITQLKPGQLGFRLKSNSKIHAANHHTVLLAKRSGFPRHFNQFSLSNEGEEHLRFLVAEHVIWTVYQLPEVRVHPSQSSESTPVLQVFMEALLVCISHWSVSFIIR